MSAGNHEAAARLDRLADRVADIRRKVVDTAVNWEQLGRDDADNVNRADNRAIAALDMAEAWMRCEAMLLRREA